MRDGWFDDIDVALRIISAPLLPSDARPPIDLNRATMDKYRPLMEKHYLGEKPVFSYVGREVEEAMLLPEYGEK